MPRRRSPSPEKLAKIVNDKMDIKLNHKVINRRQSEELAKIEESDEVMKECSSTHNLPTKTIVHFETFQRNSLMIFHTPLDVDFLDELREMAKVKIVKNKLGHLNVVGSEQQVALAKFLIQEEVSVTVTRLCKGITDKSHG